MTHVRCTDRPAFNDLFEPFFFNELRNHGGFHHNFSPSTNIYENADAFVIEMLVPGMVKTDFSISLEKELLTISTEKENTVDENLKFSRKEFSLDKFKRSFIVPKSIDVEKIVADYEAGILKVTLPKREEAKMEVSRAISVN